MRYANLVVVETVCCNIGVDDRLLPKREICPLRPYGII